MMLALNPEPRGPLVTVPEFILMIVLVAAIVLIIRSIVRWRNRSTSRTRQL
jgi:hypothetical protein